MNFRYSLLLLLGLAIGARAEDLKSIDSYRDAGAKANSQLTIPDWQQTPEAVEASARETIKKANAALDTIGKLDPKKVTFQNTVVALDDVAAREGVTRAELVRMAVLRLLAAAERAAGAA